MKKDILTREDIIRLVDAFYEKALVDMMIGPVFYAGIDMEHWEEHATRIYDFWETVFLGTDAYRGNPFSKHIHLPIENRHFDRWLELFKDTVTCLFEGDKTDEIIDRAEKMSLMFASKLNHVRKNKNWKPII